MKIAFLITAILGQTTITSATQSTPTQVANSTRPAPAATTTRAITDPNAYPAPINGEMGTKVSILAGLSAILLM